MHILFYFFELITKPAEELLSGIPKLKGISFETAIIERYRRRKSSAEETLNWNVSGRRFRTPCRGHHRSFVGN